jgi:Flp pilus assembly protein TadG
MSGLRREKRLCAKPRLRGATLAKFLRNRRGHATTEFSMVGVPLLGLLTAILETGIVFIQSMQLQQATQYAARAVLTSRAADGMTYKDFLSAYVCPKLTAMINCENVRMRITPFASGALAKDWEALAAQTQGNVYAANYSPTATINMPQTGSIALLQIVYPMNPIIAMMTGSVVAGARGTVDGGDDGDANASGKTVHLLYGTYAFKVEP